MNINFHYFAVKTIALAAGFEEDSAQQIAKYSQFVDDYSALPLMTCSNIPKEIINSKELDLFAPFPRSNFRPVSTGFANPFEYAATIVRREQRLILSPFHFAPFDETEAGVADSRVVPLTVGDNSLIDRLIHKEINDEGNARNISLMRLGFLLHVFADTYAHQGFTGFNSQANRVNITTVKNNITGEDCTNEARAGIRKLFNVALSNIPAIGHAQAGQNPDLSHISYSYISGEESHSRDNTEVLLEAGRNIFNYLNKYRGNDSANDISCDWDEIKPKLRQGMLVEMPKRNVIANLSAHWGQIFPNITFHYDSSEVKRGFKLTPASAAALARNTFSAYSEEFYGFNVMANELQIAMYGPRPRR